MDNLLWNPLSAMPAGRDYEIYHFEDAYREDGLIHSHAYYEIYLYLKGDIHIMIEERAYEVQPYDLFLFPPGLMHRHRAVGGKPFQYERAYLYLTENLLGHLGAPECDFSEMVRAAIREKRFQCHPGRERAVAMLQNMKKIIECGSSTDPLIQCGNRARLTLLVAQVCECLRGDSAQAGREDRSVAAQAMRFVNEHLTERISLDELAETLYVSKYHLSHAFKEKTGMAVYQYLLMKRVVYAQMLMQNGESPQQAAHESGFEDYAGFYRAFRRWMGYPPAEYLRRLGGDEET